MSERITSKRQMYALLARGAFGNTIAQFFSLRAWDRSPEKARYAFWGVRTLTPGGPCRLNCPTAEVRDTARQYQRDGHAVNVSCMIDRVARVTLWADVYDSPTGLLVYGVEYPAPEWSWRGQMPGKGRQWEGIAAPLLLRRHLNASSLADLAVLRDEYPGHVVELSACDRNLGTIRGRNGVVWEVRTADGSYEKW